MNVKRKKSYALTSIQNFAIFLPLSPCNLITEKYPTSLLKIWSCLSLFSFSSFPRALVWTFCPKFPSLICLILLPSARKFNRSYLLACKSDLWPNDLSDKDLGELCKQECEEIYVDCIQGCGNSDCYLDCGRDLSYCSDGTYTDLPP